MELTGKCKSDFEVYRLRELPYTESELRGSGCTMWESLDDSMKYGVYVDFFDNVGISINVTPWSESDGFSFDALVYKEKYKPVSINDAWTTRPEARTAAIEKANEIYNKKQNEEKK